MKNETLWVLGAVGVMAYLWWSNKPIAALGTTSPIGAKWSPARVGQVGNRRPFQASADSLSQGTTTRMQIGAAYTPNNTADASGISGNPGIVSGGVIAWS